MTAPISNIRRSIGYIYLSNNVRVCPHVRAVVFLAGPACVIVCLFLDTHGRAPLARVTHVDFISASHLGTAVVSIYTHARLLHTNTTHTTRVQTALQLHTGETPRPF